MTPVTAGHLDLMTNHVAGSVEGLRGVTAKKDFRRVLRCSHKSVPCVISENTSNCK